MKLLLIIPLLAALVGCEKPDKRVESGGNIAISNNGSRLFYRKVIIDGRQFYVSYSNGSWILGPEVINQTNK